MHVMLAMCEVKTRSAKGTGGIHAVAGGMTAAGS